jgi:hypothetical protein
MVKYPLICHPTTPAGAEVSALRKLGHQACGHTASVWPSNSARIGNLCARGCGGVANERVLNH